MKGVFHTFPATLCYLIFFQRCICPERTHPRFYWLTICCCAPKQAVHFPDIPKKGKIFCPLEGHFSLVFEDHPWPNVAAIFSLLIFFFQQEEGATATSGEQEDGATMNERCGVNAQTVSMSQVSRVTWSPATGCSALTCSKCELSFKFCSVIFDIWA